MGTAFKKILFALLVLAGFLLAYAGMSTKFDLDFGWNLRFGKEAVEQGTFPYTDTSTWTHQGQPWVNHEWGGDIAEWLLYRSFGYPALLLVMSLIVWGAFLCVPLAFEVKLSPATAAVSLLGLWSVEHITIMRLASVGPLFVFLLWYTLRHLHERRLYYWWPAIFWCWSALHGSWILGFIMIAVYGSVEIAKRLSGKLAAWRDEKPWSDETLRMAAVMLGLSALVIFLNPYGVGLWREVLAYFHADFFKAHIAEWKPSYAYPIYILPILFACAGVIALVAGWKQKWIRIADALLFAAFAANAFLYKRQALFLVLISIAILSRWSSERWQERSKKLQEWLGARQVRFLAAFILFVVSLEIGFFLMKIDYDPDVWHDRKLLTDAGVPYDAVRFLGVSAPGPIKIFNEYDWGGYLDWTLPQALEYLDGRGTATWIHAGTETELEHYFSLYDEKGGLQELERDEVDVILLKQTDRKTPALAASLADSAGWERVYADRMAVIWKRVK